MDGNQLYPAIEKRDHGHYKYSVAYVKKETLILSMNEDKNNLASAVILIQ